MEQVTGPSGTHFDNPGLREPGGTCVGCSQKKVWDAIGVEIADRGDRPPEEISGLLTFDFVEEVSGRSRADIDPPHANHVPHARKRGADCEIWHPVLIEIPDAGDRPSHVSPALFAKEIEETFPCRPREHQHAADAVCLWAAGIWCADDQIRHTISVQVPGGRQHGSKESTELARKELIESGSLGAGINEGSSDSKVVIR